MREHLVAGPARHLGREGGQVGSPVMTCSRDWVDAERQMRSWAVRHGLVTGEEELRRLARMGHGRMAGWLAPGGSAAELGLLAQWGACITLVDDGFDRHGQTAEQARAVLEEPGLADVLMPAVGELFIVGAYGVSTRLSPGPRQPCAFPTPRSTPCPSMIIGMR